jgi:hypothetical protein
VKIGTDMGRPVFSDERDPNVSDHAYDCVRYLVASRPPIARAGRPVAAGGTFFGEQRRLAKALKRRLSVRR